MNTSNTEALERELLDLDAAFLNAVLQHDVALVEQALPDDFLSVFPDGRVANKAAELENVRTVDLESYSTDEVQVHWYGDTERDRQLPTFVKDERSGCQAGCW